MSLQKLAQPSGTELGFKSQIKKIGKHPGKPVPELSTVLDIKHGIRGWAGEGFESYGVEFGCNFCRDIVPCAVDCEAGFALIQGGILKLRGLNGLDNLAKGNIFRRPGESVATAGSAA